jgi:hypothetical protein
MIPLLSLFSLTLFQAQQPPRRPILLSEDLAAIALAGQQAQSHTDFGTLLTRGRAALLTVPVEWPAGAGRGELIESCVCHIQPVLASRMSDSTANGSRESRVSQTDPKPR